MKKKALALLLTLGLAVTGMLTACGGGSGSGGDSGKEKAADGQVTIRFSWWGGDNRHEATLAAVRAFEAKYPNIKVEAEPSGWDGTVERITTQLAAGSEPDLMQVNFDWLTSFSKDGSRFADLTKFSDVLDLSGYDADFLKFGQMNGIQNAVPHGKNAYALALNKTAWDKVGAEIPADDWTWDDVLTAAKKFEEGTYCFDTNVGYEWFFITTYMTQLTNKPMVNKEGAMNWSAEEIEEGLLWYQNLVDNHVLPSRATMLEAGGDELFTGVHGGILDWSGGLADRAMNLAENGQELVIAPYPTIPGATTSGVMEKPTMLFAISPNSKHQTEAAMLLNFLLNDPEGIRLMGITRGTPAVAGAAEILAENGQLEGIALSAFEYTTHANGMAQGPLHEINTVRSTYDGIMEQYALGQLDASAAAQELYKQVGAAAVAALNR